MTKLWSTAFGRYVCQVLTLGEHVFTTWADQGHISGSGNPFPVAHCMRCGREF